jgi:nucleotide-binding universal stress UspA family protein
MRETLKIKLILCPIDFSEFSVSAYQHALSVAEHYQAKLVAQHVVELWRHPAASFVASAELYEEYSQALRESGKKQLREFVENHLHDEIQPELVVQEGVAADSILSFAQLQKADVIVMGTHGRRGFDRLMLGSVTDRVMRTAPCPVLAASKPPHGSVAAGRERGHVHHLSRILFCADFSENSERALKYAVSATAEYDAELTLLHVLEGAPSLAKTEEAMAVAAERLDKLIPPEGRKTLKIKTAVRIGKTYAQIIQLADEAQIDLVTMGVRGRGALDVAVFGSTTYRVMQLGSCPVLVVRSGEEYSS